MFQQHTTDTVRVYGNGCVQCKATERHLEKQGTAYVKIEITDEHREEFKAQAAGIGSLPVVTVGEYGRVGYRVWGGYNPDRLDGLLFIPKAWPDEQEDVWAA